MAEQSRTQRVMELRERTLQHLEAALACTDETRDVTAGLLIEKAIDEVRSAAVADSDPKLDGSRRAGPPNQNR